MKRILRRHNRKAVLVTLKSGVAFRGVLYEIDSEAIELWSAGLVEANGSDRQPTPVDGALVFLRTEIAYLQFV